MHRIIALTLLLFPLLGFAQVPSTALPGAFQVGEMDYSFTDNSLNSPNVSTRVYYPATTAGTGTPVAQGSFPVVGFGHGFNLNYLDYNILCGHLASWGYIVISPDVQNGFSVDHLEFARELAACIQALQSENGNSGSPFFQKIDSMTGVYGHSMGGGASALVPGVFPGIDAVSGLAAAETTPSAIGALTGYTGPFQSISGSSDNTAPEVSNQTPMYNSAPGDKQWLSITGGAHCKFTDGFTVCDLVSSAGSISREEQVYLTGKYLTAFFNYHLKNDMDALPFICGDSVDADVAAFHVNNATTTNCTAVGTEEHLNRATWSCFPNPAASQVRIQGVSSLQVYTQDGRFVKTFSNDQTEWVLPLENFAKGVYWLRDSAGGVKKLVVH